MQIKCELIPALSKAEGDSDRPMYRPGSIAGLKTVSEFEKIIDSHDPRIIRSMAIMNKLNSEIDVSTTRIGLKSHAPGDIFTRLNEKFFEPIEKRSWEGCKKAMSWLLERSIDHSHGIAGVFEDIVSSYKTAILINLNRFRAQAIMAGPEEDVEDQIKELQEMTDQQFRELDEKMAHSLPIVSKFARVEERLGKEGITKIKRLPETNKPILSRRIHNIMLEYIDKKDEVLLQKISEKMLALSKKLARREIKARKDPAKALRETYPELSESFIKKAIAAAKKDLNK